MRKKIAVVVGLVVLALLVAVLVVWFMPPAEPPLLAGMSIDEVKAVMGEQDKRPRSGEMQAGGIVSGMNYGSGPDWLGNNQEVSVHFDREGLVTHWETERLPRTRPPWLDRAIKAVGW